MLTAASLNDANGTTIPRVLVNLYGGYTGDTVGIFGKFATLLAQAYDSGGTRMVRRLTWSRRALEVRDVHEHLPGGLAYGDGEFIRGRAHSNQSWSPSDQPARRTTTRFRRRRRSGTATYTVRRSRVRR